MRDVERVGEPPAELAQIDHPHSGIGMRAAQDNQREEKEHAGCVIEPIQRESAHLGKDWHLETDDQNDREQQESNPGKMNAIMNAIEPESHYEGSGQAQRSHPDLWIAPAPVEGSFEVRHPEENRSGEQKNNGENRSS